MRMICKHCDKSMGEWQWENHSCPAKIKATKTEVMALIKREKEKKI